MQKSKQGSEFQQKHCGAALVNRHWDEEDQRHCSRFNTTQRRRKEWIFTPSSLRLCWHMKTLSIITSHGNGYCMAVRRILQHHFSSAAAHIVVSFRRKGTPQKTKGSLHSHLLYFMGLSPAITLRQKNN